MNFIKIYIMVKMFVRTVLAVMLVFIVSSCKEDNKKPEEPKRHWAGCKVIRGGGSSITLCSQYIK